MRTYHPQATRKRRSPFRFLSVITLLFVAGYTATVLLWPLQAIEATLTSLPTIRTTSSPLDWPNQGFAAIGSAEDGVLARNTDSETPVPIASITKLVTALTVLESKPLAAGESGPTVTLTAADAALYNQYIAQNGSVAPAPVGLQISQRHLLEAMLVSSANNYADTLGLWAYGTSESYFAAANTFLNKHKLTATSVADMTGFSPASKSTPSDLIKLGTIALKQPAIAEIVSQKSVAIPSVGTLQNTNVLLGSDGVNGIKTGTTDEAGSCLLFSAAHQVGEKSITVIGVIVGAPNHATLFAQARSLLASTKSNFQSITLLSAGQKVGIYQAPWGAKTSAVIQKAETQVTWSDAKITQSVTLRLIQPGDDTVVGSAKTTLGDRIFTTEAVLDAPLDSPSWYWRLLHPLEVF